MQKKNKAFYEVVSGECEWRNYETFFFLRADEKNWNIQAYFYSASKSNFKSISILSDTTCQELLVGT